MIPLSSPDHPYQRFDREFTPARRRSRTGLLLWCVLQLVLVPLELAWKLLWWLPLAVFTDEWNAQGLPKAVGRWVGPERFAQDWSRDDTVWERRLDDLITRYAADLHYVPDNPENNALSAAAGAWADPQHGLVVPRAVFGPLTADALRRVAAARGLRVGLNRDRSLVLRVAAPGGPPVAGYPPAPGHPPVGPQDTDLAVERAFLPYGHRSRTGLVLWYALQWVVVPLDAAWRIALYAVLIIGDYAGQGPDLSVAAAWRRWYSRERLGREWSRDPARWEAHLDRRLVHLAAEAHAAGADPAAWIRRGGSRVRADHIVHWTLRRDDFGPLPARRILDLAAAHRLRGWRVRGRTLVLTNDRSVLEHP